MPGSSSAPAGAPITLTLPNPLLRAARDVARTREISLQQRVKDALVSELARAHRRASSPIRADERLISMLRARLAEDFAHASDRYDLLGRLHDKGVLLREAGGGLALFGAAGGARLCKASDVGYSLTALVRRFNTPFPGEKLANRWLHSSSKPSGETALFDARDT